jgi:molybdopterin biosynthesis enzyme
VRWEAAANLGEVLGHGVFMTPGKPTPLEAMDAEPVIGIPGCPVSAVLSFEQFVGPPLSGLVGKLMPGCPAMEVYPAQNLPSKPGLTELLRVILGCFGAAGICFPVCPWPPWMAGTEAAPPKVWKECSAYFRGRPQSRRWSSGVIWPR